MEVVMTTSSLILVLAIGLWALMNNSEWVYLHNLSPETMICCDIDDNGHDDIIVDFGPGHWYLCLDEQQ